MYIVIVGGGKVGSHLAKMLAEQGSTVTLIEVSEDRCTLLADEMEAAGINLVNGDGDEPYVLDEVDVRSAAALVAATGDDEDNLVVSLLGKNEYKVPLTIARINNPRNEWLFTDEFGVDVSVSNTTMMADLLKKCAVEPVAR
jgi:trk system potassium uptake protein TrkA